MPRRALLPATPVGRVRAWFGLRQEELALYLGVGPGMVAHLEAGRRTLSAAVQAALLPLVQQLPPETELLAALAPPPEAPPHPTPPPPPALAPGSPPPEAAALALRRRECLLHAARLRTLAEALAQQATIAARWAAALPALLAALPPAEAAEAAHLPQADGAEAAHLPPAERAEVADLPSAEGTETVPTAPAGAAAAPAGPVPSAPAGPAPAGPAAFDRAAWLREWLTRRARPLPAEAATRYHLLLARAAAHAAEAEALAATLAAT